MEYYSELLFNLEYNICSILIVRGFQELFPVFQYCWLQSEGRNQDSGNSNILYSFLELA